MKLSNLLFLSLLCTLQLQALTFVNLSGVSILISSVQEDNKMRGRHLKVSNNTAINFDITGTGNIHFRLTNMEGEETIDLPKLIGNFNNNDFIIITGIDSVKKTVKYEKTDKLVLGKPEGEQKLVVAREQLPSAPGGPQQ